MCVAPLKKAKRLFVKQWGRLNITQATLSFFYSSASQITFNPKLNWVIWFREVRDTIYFIWTESNISDQNLCTDYSLQTIFMYYLFNSHWNHEEQIFCRHYPRMKPAQQSSVLCPKLTSKEIRKDLNQIWLTPKQIHVLLSENW